MAGLDPSSSSNFPPLNTNMVPNIHTTPITSSFAAIIKGHRMNDMIGKGKAIVNVEPIPQKKPNLVGGCHGEDDCRVLHPEMVQQHDDRQKVTQLVDDMHSYKGAVKSKWKPTNRNFTKNAGELMNTSSRIWKISHILQGEVEGIRSESTHEPVKAGGKMEVIVVECGDSRASGKGPLVQMEDAMVINAAVNDEVHLEIVRIEENNAEVAHQQMPSEQLENSLVHSSFQIPLQILEPSEERFPLYLQGSVVLTRKKRNTKFKM
ncbi:hypothetical protein R3W88_007706 [Solanum pinnatisectum]|uniref:Uncharacterized protein n=1 Tax=Solanum pinnatisectum TaxID=50273 RepID=A0AAV9M9A1_9SOLN|nr:hypothetical protein R3W88_007706 [Solanum pinnatisectum]